MVMILVFRTSSAQSSEVVFIVNVSNPIEKLTVKEVRDLYFKRSRQWNDGENVRFIDRTNGSLRNAFLKKYLGKTTSEIELYWIGQKLNSGNSPPLKESSDLKTMNFVATFKGAIGFISKSTVLKKSVKSVKVEIKGE